MLCMLCSASEGWLQVDLIYSGSVVVPPNQNMHGTPDQLKVGQCQIVCAAVTLLTSSTHQYCTACTELYLHIMLHPLHKIASYVA